AVPKVTLAWGKRRFVRTGPEAQLEREDRKVAAMTQKCATRQDPRSELRVWKSVLRQRPRWRLHARSDCCPDYRRHPSHLRCCPKRPGMTTRTAHMAAVLGSNAVGAAIIGNLPHRPSVPRRVHARALQQRLPTEHHNKVRRRRLLDDRQKEFPSVG